VTGDLRQAARLANKRLVVASLDLASNRLCRPAVHINQRPLEKSPLGADDEPAIRNAEQQTHRTQSAAPVMQATKGFSVMS